VHAAELLHGGPVMRPLVGAEGGNGLAWEGLAEGAVVKFPLELAADPDLAVGVPEVVAIGVAAVAVLGLLRAGVAVQSAWGEFHGFFSNRGLVRQVISWLVVCS
jgi:hypothetical protein